MRRHQQLLAYEDRTHSGPSQVNCRPANKRMHLTATSLAAGDAQDVRCGPVINNVGPVVLRGNSNAG